MSAFRVHLPTRTRIPILLSVPHCGTAFPAELQGEYSQALIQQPDDTDWFVDRLYDFAADLGITMIAANYSRWVIDLNRDPEDKPLYSDGRIITGLCPVTNFLGDPLYSDGRKEVEAEEMNRRLVNYYWPYHRRLQALLSGIKDEFGTALLWDCHSIRQYVGTVYPEHIPDLILGDADGKSASTTLTDTALQSFMQSAYTVTHNFPFKGGYITRTYGNPSEGLHALQLEMTKVNYMDDSETRYDPDRAGKMRILLTNTLRALAKAITASK